MQSPPASADAASVITLSPVFARPGASPRSTVVVNQFTQTQVLGQSGRKEQPGVCHQPMIVEGDFDAVG